VTVDPYSLGAAVGPGTVFGSYRLVSELGRGGMGVVYLAEHTIMGKQAAVKVLLPEFSGREDLVVRFFNEARAAARLHHPAFVEVFDCGVASECAFMVMEYISGENLTSCLKRETRLPVARAVGLTRVIAEAMAVAHENGIVHRDLKPDNIILPSDARASRVGPHPVKILDFGIAKLNVAASLRMTKTGTLMGTPLYMSPEQCQGSVHLDGRSDLYSLGCILYAMLTGTPPFPREGDGVVLIAHLHDKVPPLEEHGVTVSPDLEAVLMKALAKDPMDRQQSMTALVAELDAADASPGRGTMQGREKANTARSIAGAAVPAAATPSGSSTSVTLPEKRLRVPTPKATPPIASNTTLSRSSGQVAASAAPRAKRTGRSRLAVTGAIVVGVVAAVLMMRGGPRRAPAPPPVAARPQPPVVAVPAPPPPPVEAPKPARTVIELDSEPTGAIVRDPAEAEPLGTTPLRLTFERAARVLELRIEKRGYKTETLQVDLAQDLARTVPLRPRPRVVIDPDEARKL
jgi:eukaryotic-like serine/threonine-protein kinase